MSRVIAIALPKGGVGKTTTAVNLAASFALMGRNTLLIDADAFGSSAIALGITGEKIRAGLYDVFNCTHALRQVVHRTELPFLSLIPSNVRSIAMEERLLKMADNRTVLKLALRDIKKDYEFIIIDTPPYLRGMTTNAIVASDSVLIPIRAGHFSIEAVDKLMKFLQRLDEMAGILVRVDGILMTMHERHTKAAILTMQEISERYGSILFDTMIPKNSVVAESTFYGKPVALVNEHSRGAIAYRALADELLRRYEGHLTAIPPPAIPEVRQA